MSGARENKQKTRRNNKTKKAEDPDERDCDEPRDGYTNRGNKRSTKSDIEYAQKFDKNGLQAGTKH